MSSETPNIGWKYYKAYYNLNPAGKTDTLNYGVKEGEIEFKDNKELIESHNSFFENELDFNNYQKDIQRLNTRLSADSNWQLEAKVEGRGLLIGTGSPHNMGIKDEYSFGLNFDHASGLPFIPGSSLKGGLKSHFQFPEYLLDVLAELEIKKKDGQHFDMGDIKKIGKWIFKGKHPAKKTSPYKNCQFLGGCLSETSFGFQKDIITPHTKGKFKKPQPLPFLKIPAEVPFKLYFSLSDYPGFFADGVEALKTLFAFLIREHGLGAKRNYDFGRLA